MNTVCFNYVDIHLSYLQNINFDDRRLYFHHSHARRGSFAKADTPLNVIARVHHPSLPLQYRRRRYRHLVDHLLA